ncbi:MAG: hypothetical protein IPK96_03245 [Flammeovirgaceae bacterium]|jgi:hypothetical protein|nr:hypothetical protein [Flammeovirgaceae bacterium]
MNFLTGAIRYMLGLTMIAYGLIKILQIQFVLPPDVYLLPLNQLDGVTITWAFLGFSSWFSMLLGVIELVPGFLLLFRKTQLLGSLLLLPALLGVFLVNIAFDFSPPMKVLTGALLFLNLVIIYPNRILITSFLKNIVNQGSITWKELILNTFILALITFLIIYYLK